MLGNFINESMFIVDSPGPIAGEGMFQGFRFADSFKRVVLCFVDKGVDATKHFFVRFLPIDVIIPGMV
jgi:hypothetical protein